MDNYLYATPDKGDIVTLSSDDEDATPGPLTDTQKTQRAEADYQRRLSKRIAAPATLKSPYWKYFEIYEESKHNEYAICKLCFSPEIVKDMSYKWEVKVGASRSTSKLQRHIRSHHKDEYFEVFDKQSKNTTII